MRPVEVALPLPLRQLFTYLAPESAKVGSVVRVSFGKRSLWGVIWQEKKTPCDKVLKSVEFAHPCLFMDETMRQFLTTMATYTLSSLGSVLKLVLPSLAYETFIPHHISLCAPQEKLNALIEATTLFPSLTQEELCGAHPLSFWKKKMKGGAKAFKAHVMEGFFTPSSFELEQFSLQIESPLLLSPAQHQAFSQCQKFIHTQKPVLLEGITGSGKTEVLLALCHEMWKKGKQVLILLPEIVLSHQWEKRVLKYFNVVCRVWHSNLSEAVRQKTFEDILYNRCPLVIGARSALFLPYTNLGMIVVDEEHESGYKQNEGTLYHGRDMALLRGSVQKLPVVLASATPSLESRFNVCQDRYGHVHLNERYGQARLPSFECIDMRPHPPKDKQWISPALRQMIGDTFAKGEQSLLFLNRRGYACLFLCFRCNYRASCPQCSAWLSVHQKPKSLLCHYCGYSQLFPENCPGCGQTDALLMMGPGIERIHEEVSLCLPQARVALISSDHLSSPKSMQDLLTKITEREIDILVGTQLVAKGHHFPHLTTIGIIDTDFALNDMDFRASERLFQLLYQVTGRAGRAELPGRAYLQTLQPDHPLFNHLFDYDWDGFVRAELESRKEQELPPFTRMASLTISDRCEWRVQDMALELGKKWGRPQDVTLLGPAPAPMNPLRGLYRWRFLFKAPRSFPLHSVISQWIAKVEVPKTLHLQIDRDPYHFM